MIKTPADIFRLKDHESELKEREGWGDKSVENLLRNIEVRRTIPIERFIGALGIPPVGEATAKLLARHYLTFQALRDAMRAAKIDVSKLSGGTGKDLKQIIPAQSQWPADNYNHLMEQPTIFYAIALALALMGQGDGLNAQIAWAYVILRIAHSLVQATVNRVMVRFALFTLATLPLVMLAVHAAMAFWGSTHP